MLPQEEICSNIPSRKNQEEKSIQRTLGNYSWITSKIYCEFHWMDVEWHQSGFGLKPKIFKLSIGTSVGVAVVHNPAVYWQRGQWRHFFSKRKIFPSTVSIFSSSTSRVSTRPICQSVYVFCLFVFPVFFSRRLIG